MGKQTRIVILGRSLNMAGIAASLQTEAGFDVICLDDHSPATQQTLAEINPAAVAFDLSDPTPGLDVTLLQRCPGLLLIGVDPSSDELLVMSGRAAQGLSMIDLVNAILQVNL